MTTGAACARWVAIVCCGGGCVFRSSRGGGAPLARLAPASPPQHGPEPAGSTRPITCGRAGRAQLATPWRKAARAARAPPWTAPAG
eukprot:scaffold114286_cov63-Phaeocystis_antarctica.AAC.9